MKDCELIFDCVKLLHYNGCKKNLKCGGSYIDSPDCIKSKNDDKYYQWWRYILLIFLNSWICGSLRKPAVKIINFEEKKMIPLLDEQRQKSALFAKKKKQQRNVCTKTH